MPADDSMPLRRRDFGTSRTRLRDQATSLTGRLKRAARNDRSWPVSDPPSPVVGAAFRGTAVAPVKKWRGRI